MKTLHFIYNNKTIDISVESNKSLMVNATQMAQAFGKETEVFMKTDHAKNFIKELENYLENEFILLPNGRRINPKAVENRGRNGLFFERRLALKFATWLDTKFEFFIFDKMDQIILGTYKDLKEASIKKLQAIDELEREKRRLLETNPEYQKLMKLEEAIKTAGKNQNKALQETTKQLKLELFSAEELDDRKD